MDRDFTSVILKAVVAIILLCAVAIPIITTIGPVDSSVANASIINTLVNIIPVVLAVAIIIAIVYSVLVRNHD